jgi:hypothetical protein
MPCGIFYWQICGFWVFTVTSGVVFANLLEVGFEPVASKLRASTQASHGSLPRPCELRLVARPLATVLALTGCYLLLKRRRHRDGSLCTRSDAAFGDQFPGSRHVFLRLSVLNPGRPVCRGRLIDGWKMPDAMRHFLLADARRTVAHTGGCLLLN